MHQQQPLQHDEQHSHCHAHTRADYTPHSQQQQQPSTPHRHQTPQPQQQQQRKHSHSHSPHHSRHTSPHSHHSHSLHSSPHQSQQHVHEHDHYEHATIVAETPSRMLPRPIIPTQSSTSSHAHHHHHRRRRRHHNHQQQHAGSGSGGTHTNGGGSGGGSGNSSTHGPHGHSNRATSSRHNHGSGCSRRHRSATDVSSTSINTCHDPLCADREVQEIFVRKNCCSTSSRTELAQYFAEDLYGTTTSRRPSSCCTSSDYCYQTDSTSLYGSRSSLSRNNSIKSASVAMRKRRLHQRQPSYTSISLRGLNASHPNSQLGSLTSIFDRAKKIAASTDSGSGKLIVSPSKVTIERHTSKDALSNELPDYACSPSPIRWSFLADGKSPTEFEDDSKDSTWKLDEPPSPHELPKYEHDRECHRERRRLSSGAPLTATSTTLQHRSRKSSWSTGHDERPSTSAAAAKRKSPFGGEFEESTTVLFHQEGEAFNNCCNNYIQCNTYLDQDLQITSEDIHQYLSKGNLLTGEMLNNSKNYPFQPSNALEFQYKNNFANNNGTMSSEGGDSMRAYEGRFRRNSSKETNLNQNSAAEACVSGAVGGACGGAATSSCSSTPLSPTNINLSSSTNNINIVFNTSCLERNANEVKFINTAAREIETVAVSTEAHHSGYLPYTYPTYDYTNMSANSLFDKPLGIDELPKEFGAVCLAETAGGSSSDGQHSSLLQSPIQTGISFESFDAASDHNLLSRRGSYQFSPITPRSPLSPLATGSPVSMSLISASINPSSASYVHAHHQHHPHYQHSQHGERHHRRHSPASASTHHNQYHHHHFTDSFKLGNAFKKVRKRACKYTNFLRKK